MKKIYIIVLIVALLPFTSCMKDLLDKKPLDIISSADVWNDEALVNSYLAQTFAQTYVLTNECADDNVWGYGDAWFGPFIVNDMSDESKGNWEVWGAAKTKYSGLHIAGGLLEWWEPSYQVIRSLNIFLDNVLESPLEEEIREVRIAEAKFLRAFNYFSMVKRYGGVPIITKVQTLDSPQEELFPKRDTEKDVYDFIISEIDEIINVLPETTTEFGRPTKYAALALKSRAALYAASIANYGNVMLDGVVGIEKGESANYYQISYDASKAIVDGGIHALYNADADKVQNFKNIFLKKDNPEVIFARKHDYSNKEAGGTGWGYDFFQAPSPNAWGGGNQNGPYLEMVEEFENVDGSSGELDRAAIQQGLWTMEELFGQKEPRFKATIWTNGDYWKGEKVDFHNGLILPDGSVLNESSYEGVQAKGTQFTITRGVGGTSFGVMKYIEESKDNMGPRATSGTDYIVFRYAEILLNLAEAALELGLDNEALIAINEIRDRAGVADVAMVNTDIIRHERKVELAFEGQRYWDLRRWRTATEDLSRSFSGLQYILDFNTGKYRLKVINNVDGANNPLFLEKNYYLPITNARTGQNPNLVENVGY